MVLKQLFPKNYDFLKMDKMLQEHTTLHKVQDLYFRWIHIYQNLQVVFPQYESS